MSKQRLCTVVLLLLALPALLAAQYGRRSVRTIGPNNGAPNLPVPPVEMRGKLRDIDKKKIVIAGGEDQIITFKRSKKTKFFKGAKEIGPDDFPDNAQVVVEANRVMNGDYDAINVYLGEPPSANKSDTAGESKTAPNSSSTSNSH